MKKFTQVSLGRHFNSPTMLRSGKKGKGVRWHSSIEDMCKDLPHGKQSFWGIPFMLGPAKTTKKGVIVIADSLPEVTIPLKGKATHVCFAHFCNAQDNPEENAAGGERLAEYVVQYRDVGQQVQSIRRRFEINSWLAGWGRSAFAAQPLDMGKVAEPSDSILWRDLQTGHTTGSMPCFGGWVFALGTAAPEKDISSITLRGCSKEPVAILGITLYNGPGHPLRHVPRRIYKLILPPNERAQLCDVKAEIDMGHVTRVFAVPGKIDQKWLKATGRGLGRPCPKERPQREFLVEATMAEGATLTVKPGKGKKHELSIGEAFTKGKARSSGGARVEVLHPHKTWVYVNVIDSSTDKPTPTRIHFSGPNGEYIPPYGHHAVVNDNWFEDYGGDLQLGGTSYAYVPGRFQTDLPVGEIYVEMTKGFEYAPVRRKINIRPGQRELNLKINRWTDLRKESWVTADTHVHFISPQTAWLEGQGEGLNLVNLLASQWGKLHTNVADITGELSGCSADDTSVWVGTENRNHLLGHISMLGTHGDPVFPMCCGGLGEAFFGDPEYMTLTEWAETCKEREGVVIRPHFPAPICEEPAYFLLDKLDGAELRRFASSDSKTLDEFCFKEWYRYLNCGCRVAAVGGTDKMSAGMPVGGVRTYAKLSPDKPFTFENWGEAVRAGRTFTSSGPLIDLVVDGHHVGDEIRMPTGGGTVEVHATARCVWPIHKMEVIVNGKVVAATSSRNGAKALSIRRSVRLDGSCWIAARCSSRLQVHHCWPIYLGAHTSPIYVVAGKEEIFSPSDATYMHTLLDGGMTYLDTLSVRFDEKRHRQLKAVFEKARKELRRREHHHHGHHSHVRP